MSTDVVKNSFANYSYEDSFTVFVLYDSITQLVYATKDKNIYSYDLNEMRIINTKTKAHESYITNLKHIYHENDEKDIIMSISKKDNIIKLWNAENFNNIKTISEINNNYFLYSACFLKDNNNYFIITTNGKNMQDEKEIDDFETIKII